MTDKACFHMATEAAIAAAGSSADIVSAGSRSERGGEVPGRMHRVE